MSIIFRDELSKKVMAGEKTVTRRVVNLDNRRAHWHPDRAPTLFASGRKHAVLPGRGQFGIGHIEIVSLERERAFEPIMASLDDVRAEGFRSRLEFIEVWVALGNPIPADVWRVEFEVVE